MLIVARICSWCQCCGVTPMVMALSAGVRVVVAQGLVSQRAIFAVRRFWCGADGSGHTGDYDFVDDVGYFQRREGYADAGYHIAAMNIHDTANSAVAPALRALLILTEAEVGFVWLCGLHMAGCGSASRRGAAAIGRGLCHRLFQVDRPVGRLVPAGAWGCRRF